MKSGSLRSSAGPPMRTRSAAPERRMLDLAHRRLDVFDRRQVGVRGERAEHPFERRGGRFDASIAPTMTM